MEKVPIKKHELKATIVIVSLAWLLAPGETTNPNSAACHTAGRFGERCKYICHCADDSPCNPYDGTCSAGCHPDFFGPGCQYALGPRLCGSSLLPIFKVRDHEFP
ncbi:receptor-type tyrosine-protein phosphatase kappa [Elysia marginata]|uniref:Receptor-type tyrosine-protein phosphatase kappa n=1 Tax=Elysia marginata TaxID=1093978 RepID=A0AAV4GHK2_9GAST|nr:receptor-type tyrosine-protein phosphatase kappa [Elysia marginata]